MKDDGMKLSAQEIVGVSGEAMPVVHKTGGRSYLLRGIVVLAIWWLVYHSLASFAAWFT